VSELEEALMSIVGGVDIHRKQLTYDYVEPQTGRWERGRIVPVDRQHLADWLTRFEGVDEMCRSRWRAAPDGGTLRRRCGPSASCRLWPSGGYRGVAWA
jgi:hypothetical protein